MPAPDGREWIASSALAQILKDCIEAEYPQIKNLNISVELQQSIEDCFVTQIGLGQERKISRLNEALKDAVARQDYGPLSDAEGLTDLGTVYQDWSLIYTQAFLDNFDEEGNLIGD